MGVEKEEGSCLLVLFLCRNTENLGAISDEIYLLNGTVQSVQKPHFLNVTFVINLCEDYPSKFT